MAQLLIRSEENSSDLAWISRRWQQPIQRIFWLYDVPSHSFRGGHSHQAKCQMALCCPVGRVTVYVQNAKQDYIYTLQESNQYLFLDGSDWRLMYGFSTNAVLTVLASYTFETTIYRDQPYRPVPIQLKSLTRSFSLD